MAIQSLSLKRFKKKLDAIPVMILDEMRLAMEQGAQEIVDMAKSMVAVDSGDLRDSIGWTWGEPPKGSMILGSSFKGKRRSKASRRKEAAMRADGLILTIFAGNSEAFYVRWIEFGTVLAGAQPFFYPAYRANKKKMKSRTRRAVKKAINVVKVLR